MDLVCVSGLLPGQCALRILSFLEGKTVFSLDQSHK